MQARKRSFQWAILGVLVMFSTMSNAGAQQTWCAQCGKYHTSSASMASGYQAQAQAEAQQMASRQFKGHVQGTVSGVRFSGVGWSSSSANAPTCTPSSGMTLVADAVARGADGWYRVRYWR
jgi:hypothetical protein